MMLTKEQRWETALEALWMLERYRFTGTFRFSMTDGKVSVNTLSRLRAITDAVQAGGDPVAHPEEELCHQK